MFVLSFAIPVKFAPKREMGIGWNFQWQYALPRNTTMVETYPPTVSRSDRALKEAQGNNIDNTSDRAMFYNVVESMLNKEGINGRDCLLRTICENAEHSASNDFNGFYGQILHILLTPSYGTDEPDLDLDIAYVDAQSAGEYGVDCRSLYPGCDLDGRGFFDLFSVVDLLPH
ncbi:uncharacterized protein LOC132702444 isoform X2 [Cylas formicarius]|uniref:uncharacterized protein LOC132702444 isoform X2 n=1 Tax=Cylas formicarius TaxID=197179 RepID=UPI002958D1A7|nr:uncharacterized protein LOC132702444 isoform X2 [Cylas formicarius]